mmetsp:Transcript_15216/g.30542  ORF Transcript_15216/g.30542 Transcript_15216/m.30542 type:complete len:196 (+) Transcript_15216:731-1318(+)
MDGMRELARRIFFPGHSTLSKARAQLLEQALLYMPIILTCDGFVTSAESVCKAAFERFIREHPNHSLQTGRISLEFKLTCDERVVSDSLDDLHTELMLVLLHPFSDDECQRPSYHYTLGVYMGKDDAEPLIANFSAIAADLLRLSQDGFQCGEWTVVLEIIFPADMSTHWNWYGAGGISATHFCPLCMCNRNTCH